jgi:3-methyladenine DNA glycosylase AlkC
MPEQLKNMFFTDASINEIGDTIQRFHPVFDKETFIKLIFSDGFESMELKEKMRHMTKCLHETLPESYQDALEILKKAAPYIKGFELMSLPDYVELYGMDDWDLSFEALGYITKYASGEFAIRPFLDRDPERTMAVMLKWAHDDDWKVRRLASEGCRPRLPWAMALPKFKKNPAPILPVLEILKDDPSEDVRRSVANNLNDISKDNPEITLDICEKWQGQNKNVDAIIKHACRTMLKAGNKRAMILFGFGDPTHMNVVNLKTESAAITIGEDARFSFDLIINEKEKCKARLEYAVYYMKANEKLSKKVFKITENSYPPGKHSFNRKQSFADMSTRKHYPGEHQVSIIVNGEEKAKTSFELTQ